MREHSFQYQKKIAVIGIGRVGLPLSLFLADHGFFVYGIDKNEEYIRKISEDKLMPFHEEGATSFLQKYVNKTFIPTSSIKCVSECDVVIITIGTPIDEHMNPVLKPVESVISSIIPFLKKDQLIILRSTLSPGTTSFLSSYFRNIEGFTLGENIFLSFCPERIAQGFSLKELSEIPQIVGGIDEASTKKASLFFESMGIRAIETDAMSSELAKLFCNMYRYIDFAISNEFMMIASEYKKNIYDIISMVNSGYKRGGIKLPGHTGGPCLYKDGFFLIEKTPYPELISNAWKINESVPMYLVSRIENEVSLSEKTVGLFGLAFKKDNDDTRNSLSYKWIKILKRKGAKVIAHDPFLEPIDINIVLKNEIIVFATNHSMYSEISLSYLKDTCSPDTLVCDVWNIFKTSKIIFFIRDL